MSLVLTRERIATPLGPMDLVCDGEGRLRAADFADCPERLMRSLARSCGQREWAVRDGAVAHAIAQPLAAYFEGDLAALQAIPVAFGGTSFRQAVWRGLRQLPPGQTLTYGSLAQRLGYDGGARAVGHANGANPCCVVIPCHRLVGASGALTGYSGGLHRKRWLIAHEARHTA